jgi:hypothetical protein
MKHQRARSLITARRWLTTVTVSFVLTLAADNALSQAGSGAKDENGVAKIYPDNPKGSYYVMGKVNADWWSPKGSGSGKVVATEISPTEYEFDSRGEKPSRPKVFADNNRYNGPDVSIEERNKQGYIGSRKDWVNIEFTAYLEYLDGGCAGGSHGGDEFSLVTLTSHDGGKLAGAAYHHNVEICGTGVRFKKENYHVDYQSTKHVDALDAPLTEKRQVGVKAIAYNIDAEGRFTTNMDRAVGKQLELWLDKDLNNNWEKVSTVKDTFDAGFDGEESYPPLIGGANEVIMKSNNLKFRVSKISVREILPR